MCTVLIWAALLPLASSEESAHSSSRRKSLQPAIDAMKAVRSRATPSSDVLGLSSAFSSLNEDDLNLLKEEDDTALALRAEWEKQKRLVFSTAEDNARKVPPRRFDRFFGFIEGRLKTCIPGCWESAVRQADVHQSMIGFYNRRPPLYVETPLGLAAPKSLRVTLLDDKTAVELALDDESATVPIAVIEKLKGKGCQKMTACMHEENCLILGQSGLTGILVSYDLDSRRCRWESHIWGSGPLLLTSGPPETREAHDCADVVCASRAAIVFGVSGDAAYIESFSLSDGGPIFRFSTNDWQVEGGLAPRKRRE